MEGRKLLQYIIDTSDVVIAKKQEATEYLAKLEGAAQQSAQSDVAYVACPYRSRVNHPAIGEIAECEFVAPVTQTVGMT